ncbi:MAG: hypothetical protein JNM81_17710 [Rhodospirillaceae bacterium]|nr:hypothetical protein [Rhodospirillaceae bacterium]
MIAIASGPAIAADSEVAATAGLPASTSAQFCVALQQYLASTAMTGENTLFDSMAPYRHSKPSIKPLQIYQVVTYAKKVPVVVSCKMKTAAHIRDIYGPEAAGEQKFCDDAAKVLQHQAVTELRRDGHDEAAAKAAAFIVDHTEPYVTGQAYLNDFTPITRGPDGVVHISTPGLYQNYDSWYTPILPEIVKGQSYCHLASVELMKAVALGDMAPGLTVTTVDDAPTRPQ